MKKKLLTVGIVLVIIIFCGFSYFIFGGKSSEVQLSQKEINTRTEVVNQLMSSINNKDFNEFKSLTDKRLGTEGNFNKIYEDFNNNLGTYENSTYEKAILDKGQPLVVYDANFSKKKSVNLNVIIQGKTVEGVYYNQ